MIKRIILILIAAVSISQAVSTNTVGLVKDKTTSKCDQLVHFTNPSNTFAGAITSTNTLKSILALGGDMGGYSVTNGQVEGMSTTDLTNKVTQGAQVYVDYSVFSTNEPALRILGDIAGTNAENQAAIAYVAATNAEYQAQLAYIEGTNALNQAAIAFLHGTNGENQAAIAYIAATSAQVTAASAYIEATNALNQATLAGIIGTNAEAIAQSALIHGTNAEYQASLAYTEGTNALNQAAIAYWHGTNAEAIAQSALIHGTNAEYQAAVAYMHGTNGETIAQSAFDNATNALAQTVLMLKLDGTRPMTGNLNMGGFGIWNWLNRPFGLTSNYVFNGFSSSNVTIESISGYASYLDLITGRMYVTATNSFTNSVDYTLYDASDRKGSNAYWRATMSLIATPLSAEAAVGASTLSLADATGYSTNDLVWLGCSNEFARVVSVSGNDLTVENTLTKTHLINTAVSRVAEFGGFSIIDVTETGVFWSKLTAGSIMNGTIRVDLNCKR